MRYETFSIFPTTIYLGELDDHEKYKEEFYKATGLDPSGKPDLRTAATAFGLALMQN